MTNGGNKVRIHIKNNRWRSDSFPNTLQGEEIFTITRERFEKALVDYPDLKDRIEIFIDWDEDNFAESMSSAEILITWNFPTLNLKKIAPKLKWIHCIGAGVEHLLPFDWLSKSVVLTNNKGVHAKKVGEYGLMAALMLHNHLPKIITNQHTKSFEQLYGTPISECTIVIVGTGSLGGAIALLLESLGPKIIGVNRQGKLVKGFTEVVSTNQLDNVLTNADILFLALPETPETIGLIDYRRLNLLKPNCGIVNIGRQSAIDYQALCENLKDGKIAGAILDVFKQEPISSESYLWKVPNLIITPHISADDGKNYVNLTLDLFFNNLERYLSGQSLINKVNKELGY